MSEDIKTQNQNLYSRHIRSWLAFAMIIIVATAVGHWAWQKGQELSPTPSLSKEPGKGEFSDWKIYRNEEYGFEFKYPANRKLNVANNSVNISDKNIIIDILLTRVNSKSAIDATKGIGTELLYPLVDLSEGEVVFAGVSAERISYSVNGRFERNIIPLKLNPTVRIILRNNDSISNQILSTFKFIDSID